jgi:hypothetical protein
MNFEEIWDKFRNKYKNCWLVCDKDSDVGNGNLSWLMDKFIQEERKRKMSIRRRAEREIEILERDLETETDPIERREIEREIRDIEKDLREAGNDANL